MTLELDRSIAAVETTMADLSFSHDAAGCVRITDSAGAREVPSLLERSPPDDGEPEPRRRAGWLPMELVCLVLSFVPPADQSTFAAASKVCRQWYFASTQYLYASPQISSKNFDLFGRTIAPHSTNLKPSPLASLVRRLDMSKIVNEAKRSYTPRLLRRTADSLEEFIAPQTSFGYLCLVALGQCRKLRLLDLSLISQSVVLEDLFRHIQGLPNLLALSFPRSSVYTNGQVTFQWPSRLEKFALAGSVSNTFLRATGIPPTLKELHVSHCPFTTHHSVQHLLSTLSSQLTRLSVFLIPRLPFDAMNGVLRLCPNLQSLLVAADYITSRMLDECNVPADHPLRELTLESSGNMGTEKKISPNDVFIAVAEERLANLRVVKVTSKLGWSRERDDVQDLVELLESRAKDAGVPESEPVGVWEFESDGLALVTYNGLQNVGLAKLIDGLFSEPVVI